MVRHSSRRLRLLRRRGLFLATALASGAAVFGLSGAASAAGGAVSNLACVSAGGVAVVEQELPRNDDSWIAAQLGFTLKLGSAFHSSTFIDNNGYITFGQVPASGFGGGSYASFRLDTTWRTIIAPFTADIDTRGALSGVVKFCTTKWDGHRAFRINWGDPSGNGVGYYDQKTDLLNKFQLVLVDRSDVGVGDFDIIMNYDQIQWEGPPAPPSPGLPTWIGYAPGNPFSVPGSGTVATSADGKSHALTAGTLNSGVLGRYIHEIRGGLPVATGVVAGTLYAPDGLPLDGAIVQLCRVDGTCFYAVTDLQGNYAVSVPASELDGSPFGMTASAPPGATWLFPSTPIEVTPVSGALLDDFNVLFEAPNAIPDNTVLAPSSGNPSAPAVYWKDVLQLFTHGCSGGTAAYTVYEGQSSTSGTVIVTGPMTESAASPGLYEASIPPLYPRHGWSTIAMQIDCADGSSDFDDFNVYIDPSGNVNNVNGNPIQGAVVTLYRSEQALGPFEIVRDGSALMSPSNRQNPMFSDERGHFGWDTLAGYYIVRAEKAGCTSAGDPAIPYAETAVLPVPPPVTDLDIRLDCSAAPAPSIAVPATVTANVESSAGAVVAYSASAADVADGAVPVTCLPESGSLFPLGLTTVTCEATNSYGNTASATFGVHVVYEWGGVLAPLSESGTSSVDKNLVKVRFELDGASASLAVAGAQLFVAPVVGGVVGVESPAQSVGKKGNVFNAMSAAGAYELFWFTKGLAAGTYQVRIDLGDGALHTAMVSLAP